MSKWAAALLILAAAIVSAAPSAFAKPATSGSGSGSILQSGTWTFTDFTPDPTTLQEPAERHCHGTIPAGPADVNAQPIKLKKGGRLELTAHNMLDWAMEVHDKNGNVITGTDGGGATDPENMDVILSKGSYIVVYCSFAGEPSITVDYEVTKV